MSTGLLSIRQRQVAAPEVAARQKDEKELHGGSYKWFVRGKGHAAAPDDFRIESKRRKALKDYDKYLKAFQYGNALDAALSMHPPALTVVSLLQELVHRDGLRAALAGRDDIALEPLAQFIVKNITNPRFTPLLVDVTITLGARSVPAHRRAVSEAPVAAHAGDRVPARADEGPR
ncbi:MAG: UTP15 C terminal-domain-containing protein [Olpidium bornovanus]|uniref:UTP15 C terminal-domain-containing protein n=1 Tax=Olpidium bornovanus TaxID=278681 RepID=A0A8H8DJF5_9FUNG|nr:MAG: UTP15 C terminal-domain-containing protein [Olpidium bornovanus]